MKDLIIGASTNYDWSKLKYWINSINQSGFEGEKVLILMNCDADTVKKVIDSGFKIIAFNQDESGNLSHQSNLPIHVERFIHIYNHLSKLDYRYVITTDVKDVIFQKNPIDYIEKVIGDKDLIFASESMLYADEPWGNQNLLETYGSFVHERFKENEIYNVGVLAGRAEQMKDLAMNIFGAAMGKPIPICDQSTFNFLISMHPYTKSSHYLSSEDAWAAQLGTTVDPSKIDKFGPLLLEPSPKIEGDVVVTSQGEPFTIVHQYDRVPEWKNLIEAKYG